MEHRNMSNQVMIPGRYQHENNHPPVEGSCIPIVRGVATENGHFFTPMDHRIRSGAQSTSHWYLGSRSNEYHPSNIPPFSRPSFDPYTHTSTNGNTSFAPAGPVGHIYSTHVVSESGGPLKRKTPCVYEGSSSGFYGEGSSSSSQMLIQEHDVDRLSRPRPPYMGSNLSINGQDSVRIVRRRFGPELEPCMTRTHAPNYASQYYQPTTHSENYPAPVHHVNPSADVMGREWNIVPYAAFYHGRTSHSNINDLRRESSQFYAGGSSVDIGVSHHNPFFRGNLTSSSQNPHISHVQQANDVHSYHHQRVQPFYRNGPSYYNYNTSSSSSTNELQFPPESVSSRYSRYSAAGGSGGGGYTSGRPQIAVVRPQPLVDVMDSHHGFGPKSVTDEQSSFYSEPEGFPDEYQDMRLDIDSMSYEELLALQERIGYVSSGLSEDGMSKCLREKIFNSVDQNQDTCSICLEEYKNGEKIGRIENCGHEYHGDCIKKWVVMKKVCPICKSEC